MSAGSLELVDHDLGAAFRQRPRGLLDLRDRARLDVEDLTELAKHRIDREEALADALLDGLADGLELVTHMRVDGPPEPIVPMHRVRVVMARDRGASRKTGDEHLVAAAEAAVGVGRAVADEHRDVGIERPPGGFGPHCPCRRGQGRGVRSPSASWLVMRSGQKRSTICGPRYSSHSSRVFRRCRPWAHSREMSSIRQPPRRRSSTMAGMDTRRWARG